MKLANSNFVFTTKISIDAENFLEVREPTMTEFQEFPTDAKAADYSARMFKAARKILPRCIVDSSFEDENGEKANGAAVWAEIEKSASLSTRVVNDWLASIPFRADEKATASA